MLLSLPQDGQIHNHKPQSLLMQQSKPKSCPSDLAIFGQVAGEYIDFNILLSRAIFSVHDTFTAQQYTQTFIL